MTSGYGQFGVGGSIPSVAHRISWELANGPIPDGLMVLHRCDVRACVRPDHLFLLAKGRGKWTHGDAHASRRDPLGYAAHFKGRAA